MRIRFKTNEGHSEGGFKANKEYDMDEKSAQHWVRLGRAVPVTDTSKAPRPDPSAPNTSQTATATGTQPKLNP